MEIDYFGEYCHYKLRYEELRKEVDEYWKPLSDEQQATIEEYQAFFARHESDVSVLRERDKRREVRR